jgi:UDP:flavonoid glycosyltransferase YjiC (YdhE family)
MHVTILTLGSRGDVVPYLALGRGLRRADHDVRVITFEDFEPMVRDAGLDFAPMGGEMRPLLSGGAGLSMSEAGTSVIRMSLALLRMFRSMAQGFADDLSAPELRKTDIIVNQLPGALFGLDLAQAARVPMTMAALMPLVPTRYEPMLMFPRWLAPIPGYNRLTHWIAYQIAWGMFRSTIGQWRAHVLDLGPPPFWGSWGLLQDQGVPVFNAYSPHLAPPPPDWGPHIHTTGAWFEDEEDWTPPEDLVRFIEAGSPPVYIGFGSMPSRRPECTTQAVLRALERVGLRAVIHAGWGGLVPQDLPPSIHAIGIVPHAWLFPRMAAVVHHGGSGTTHAGLRAGRPSILVPFVFDQFTWGRRVAALGVGPPAIPHSRLSSARLADALDQAAYDPEMQRRAEALQRKMQTEGGVCQAVQGLQSLLM